MFIWVLFSTAVILFVSLWILWLPKLGFVRASLAVAARVGWMLPLALCLFPINVTESIPQSPAARPLYLLVDDSESMTDPRQNKMRKFEQDMQAVMAQCQEVGCNPTILRLSEAKTETKHGYTPLAEALEGWMFRIGEDPWILFSDGGDSMPTVAWPSILSGWARKAGSDTAPRGVIAAYQNGEEKNIWLSKVGVPPFAFQDNPIQLEVVVARSSSLSATDRVQVQAMLGGHLLTSINAAFDRGLDEISLSLVLPPLEKGQHLVTVRVLPVGEERQLWDNESHQQIEVMANTLGVLHLLGAPSWDGRFMRRYLKSEPKFDLISFFILRDPWDSQQVSERELSLIPFPVKRLFEDELPNFRLVVLQNFALHQFLEPQFQQNLVNFVKQGGSMLFLGGPRALQAGDLSSSALAEILPFERRTGGNPGPDLNSALSQMSGGMFEGFQSNDPNAPAYDPQLHYKIQLAQPNESERALADVIDEWGMLSGEFAKFDHARGLHRVDRVKFRAGSYTPLLHAKLDDGSTIPLAVASYPGNGRAIWMFTDSLWRMAMAPQDRVSRQSYHRFLSSALSWLLRDEARKPLVAKDLQLRLVDRGQLKWSVDLRGQAVKYFNANTDWTMKLCGQVLDPKEVVVDRLSSGDVHVSGTVALGVRENTICNFDVQTKHKAFGSLSTRVSALVPKVFTDAELAGSMPRLKSLAAHTHAELLVASNGPAFQEKWQAWMRGIFTGGEELEPIKFRTVANHYWFMERWWFWLALLCMPLEILIRRWHLLVGGAGSAWWRALRRSPH